MNNAGLESPVLTIFVDKIKIIAPKESEMIEHVKVKLASTFSMADMELISFYLGLKVEQNQEKKTIKLSQPSYINKVLAKFYLDKVYFVNNLMKKSVLF